MDRAASEIFERLGADGLARVLGDVLDHGQLVQLATACGIKYRGMRTQSQSRERLLADLVDHAGKHDAARQAILRALRKEAGDAEQEWSALDPEEKARRLCDEGFLTTKGNLGLQLYLLVASGDARDLDGYAREFAQRNLARLMASGNGAATPGTKANDEGRLRRRSHELEKKVKHLDAQLSKSRESEKIHKRDLIQRKGELAESRMLVERLRAELAQAQSAVRPATPPTGVEGAVTELGREVKKLANQQKKLAHAVEKLPAGRAPSPGERPSQAVAALDAVRHELAALREQHAAAQLAGERRLEALMAELRRQPPAARAPRRSRAKGAGARVGVFIDVQNVYYGARRLKGKLDFDALLDAAVSKRRLILATAYVVETKETDQTQFIQVLQKRAIEVRRKTLNIRTDGSMKGDWDMELALDVLDAADNLDVVVLVSGDGDFTSLVKRVKAIGPRVEVIAFPRHTAKALVEAADEFKPLDRKFMIYPRRSRTGAAEHGGSASEEAAEESDATAAAGADLAASAP
jgi:uncharacterized LabA/DUF88 family protein